MSTRASNRRSRRAPKRISDYNVGDCVEVSRVESVVVVRCHSRTRTQKTGAIGVVSLYVLVCSPQSLSLSPYAILSTLSQINRSGVTLKARLAQLLTEGTSPNPRWLIKFDGQPYKDEEVYEHTFGKLLIAADDEPDPAQDLAAPPPRRSKSTSSSSNNNNNSGKKSPVPKENTLTTTTPAVPDSEQPNSPATGAGGDDDSDKKKSSPSVSNENSPTASDESGTDANGKKKSSAREARSNRRQEMIDESGGVLASAVPAFNSNKRRMNAVAQSKSKKRARDGDEQVVKVKLLTGTLYLYRGQHRRAEFIRRV